MAGVAQGGLWLPSAVQSVCKWYAYVLPSHQACTVCRQHGCHSNIPQTILLIAYLETYLGKLEHWLQDWKIAVSVTGAPLCSLLRLRHIQMPDQSSVSEPVSALKQHSILGDSSCTADLDGIHQPCRKKGSSRSGMLGCLFNNRCLLSIRNSVLLHKELKHPVEGYECLIWRSSAHSHVWKLQVLQSMCLHIASDAPWYVSNRQIYEDFWIPFFINHSRSLTGNFDLR